MKCPKCYSDVLESFRFCHKCGEVLVVESSSRSESTAYISTESERCVSGPSYSTPSLPPKGTLQTQRVPRVESFNEFRKRKSSERVQKETSKKGKKPLKVKPDCRVGHFSTRSRVRKILKLRVRVRK